MDQRQGLLRERGHGQHEDGRVKFVELFFDLVFVFAVTQLSHLLLEHLSVQGALETGLLLLAVWWVWVFTSWVTNWLDPDRTPVRLLLFAMMLAGLVMSSSIPQAFGERALSFALAYVAMQVGRCLFMLWALKSHDPGNYRNFQRITVWLTVAGMFWIAGALAPPQWRLALWGLGMLIEFVAPSVGFHVPGLGRSTTSDWNVSGEHMAERCGLFIIIALGESVLLTGATWAGLEWTLANTAAMAIAVIGSIAMWWVYFHIGAERARGLIGHSTDPGRLARLAYTYIHILLVAGVIVVAVGDELILKHPDGHADARTAAVLIAGPPLFLVGNLLFKWVTAGWPPLSHMAGLAMLALLAPIGILLSPLTLAAWATAVLVLVAIWEARSLGSTTARPGP
jgi:low temperature requirement protein LtrA